MSCPCQFQKNDYGTILTLTFQQDGADLDISLATTKEMIFKDPNGNVTTKTALFSNGGSDGEIYYVVESGLFNTVGTWEVEGKVIDASGSWRSEIGNFKVNRILE
jgi:hypothetical protein